MEHTIARAQEVFERREKKYLLDRAQYEALRRALEPRMEPDRYGRYTICSVYCDTDDFTLVRRSLEKPAYKEKLRLRSYGIPRGGEAPVYLELKKKLDGVVYKRRAPLALGEARTYLAGGILPRETQILREIDYFVHFYRPRPRVFLAYDRCALADRGEEGLRMTFDTALRWRDTALDLGEGDWGAPLLGGDCVLLEVKLPNAMPLWLCRLFSELGIYPASFSKYGECYRRFLSKGLAASQVKGGGLCA